MSVLTGKARTRRSARSELLRKRGHEVELKSTNELLDLQILYLLRNNSHTLYSIKGALLENFGARRSFGTIHPHLTKLEDLGLVSSHEEEQRGKKRSRSPRMHRRIYRLTARGRNHLHKEVESLSRMVLAMTA